MKKIILGIIATFGISSLSFGQLTLENTYQTKVLGDKFTNVFNTDNGINYYTLDNSTNILNFYNSNHILFKTLTIPVDSGSTLNNIYYPCDKLFNNDNLIEFIVTSRIPNIPPATGSTYKTKLMNENGVVIQQFVDNSNCYLVKGTTNNYKLIVNSGYNTTIYTYQVYSLAGTLSIAQQNLVNKQFIGYPNPTENIINISNNIPNGENAILEVFDTTGKKVIQKNVVGENGEINLDTTELSNGVYIYKLNGQSNRFIKK